MPQSMMIADVGLKPNVIGISSAIPAIGPSPGRMPTRVPATAPSRQYRRLAIVVAIPKPAKRCWIDSNIPASYRPISPFGRGIFRN